MDRGAVGGRGVSAEACSVCGSPDRACEQCSGLHTILAGIVRIHGLDEAERVFELVKIRVRRQEGEVGGREDGQ